MQDESLLEPVLNLQIARAYLTASDPAMPEITEAVANETIDLPGLVRQKQFSVA